MTITRELCFCLAVVAWALLFAYTAHLMRDSRRQSEERMRRHLDTKEFVEVARSVRDRRNTRTLSSAERHACTEDGL
ncbi:MAG: hypothetical protein V4710_19090 [Verrucomicrobiota bacterium]